MNLTINLKLQNFAQSILPLFNKGSIVLLNRFDGSILSMNSNPTYDAQVFEDRENDTINSLLNDLQKPLINRAFSGFYPPGSVFKPIPALLGLKKNIINESTEVVCTGSTSLADRNYYCWKKGGHGRVNLKKAIKESDIIFICVGTPNKKGTLKVNLSFVYKCVREILSHTKKKKIIVTKSTVPIGTGDEIEKILKKKKKLFLLKKALNQS